MSAIEVVAGAAVYAMGCTLQGVIGFGANVLAVPLLALINPQFVPGPVLIVNPVLAGFYTFRDRGSVDVKGLRLALTGRIPGIVLAVLTLDAIGEDRIGVLFGILLLAAAILKLAGMSPKRTSGTLLACGCVSGFMGTAVGVGGPPIALLYQDVSGSVLRATMSPYLLVGSILSVSALALGGHFDTGDLLIGLYLVPAALLGVALSNPLRTFLDRGWIAPGVYILSSFSALALLIRSLA